MNDIAREVHAEIWSAIAKRKAELLAKQKVHDERRYAELQDAHGGEWHSPIRYVVGDRLTFSCGCTAKLVDQSDESSKYVGWVFNDMDCTEIEPVLLSAQESGGNDNAAAPIKSAKG